LRTAFIFAGSLSLICKASLCFSTAPAGRQASGTSSSAAKIVRSIRTFRRLFDFVFSVFDVLLGDRVVFLLFHLVRLRARILARDVIVPRARTGNEFDLETDGLSHGIYLLT